MADYKVVDVEKLETELTEVAEEVRILADTQEKMSINKMTENVAQANDTIEVQKDIILEIKTTLEGKANGSKEEQEKSLDVIENGSYTLFPDEGKALSSATVNVNIPPKEEQEKTVEITKNGITEVIADEGKTLSKVTVETSVLAGGEPGKPYIDTSKMTSFYSLFYNRVNLEIIDNIDTSNGTIFERMFSGCYVLSSIPQLDTSKGTNFANMFWGCSLIESIPQLDTSNGTNFASMFYSCAILPSIPQLDTSKGTNFNSMFEGCQELTSIPQLDTSNGTNFNSMFYGCSKLTSIPQLDISKGTNFKSMFTTCSALETVSLTKATKDLSSNTFYNCPALKNITIGEGWAVDIYLHYSNNLTVESLHGMIENLADLTGLTAKTFQVGATNLAKIDEAHMTMLQNKNWNYL